MVLKYAAPWPKHPWKKDGGPPRTRAVDNALEELLKPVEEDEGPQRETEEELRARIKQLEGELDQERAFCYKLLEALMEKAKKK